MSTPVSSTPTPGSPDLETALQDRTAELERQGRALADAQRIAHVGSFEWLAAEDRLTWSAELHRIYGTDPVDFGGDLNAYMSRVHPEDREMVSTKVQRVMEAGGRFDLEERILRPDGHIRTLATTGEALLGPTGRVERVIGACRDITEQRALEDALAWMERRSSALIESSSDILSVIGVNGLMLFVSKSVTRTLGFTPSELVGGSGLRLVHIEDLSRVSEAMDEVVANPDSEARVEYRVRTKDGRWIWLESIISDCLGDSTLHGLVFSTRDMTARKEHEQALVHRSLHDELTGLPNQVLLADRLQQALARRDRRESGVAALHVDVDHFTWLNDVLGRARGDQVLVAVADKLQVALGPAATVSRVGADEFVLVVEDVGSPAMAQAVADGLAGLLAGPVDLGDQAITVSASIGVAYAGPSDPVDAEALLRDADSAVHWAKERGPVRTKLFDRDIRTHRRERMGLEQALERAVEREEFDVHYQPIVELRTGKAVGFEALVRWVTDDGRLLYPEEFIPVAEETGLVIPMGYQVMRKACDQIGRWNQSRPDAAPLYVAVNLSPSQLMAGGLLKSVRNQINASGIDPSWLWFELTESALIYEVDAAEHGVSALKDLGVRLAIDDFGTGYSSLSYLKRFSVDAVKIDRSFVAGLGRRGVDDSIVTGVINLATALEITPIAEGVEEPLQRGAVSALGCQFGQGYLWSPPLPAAEASDWVDRA